jgi:hypothetical protein
MEHFSGRQLEEQEADNAPTKNVERLSNWVTGMQAEFGSRRVPEISPDNDNRKEVDFEKTKEAPNLPDSLLKGSMIAVGEVLADKAARSEDSLSSMPAVSSQPSEEPHKLQAEEDKLSSVPIQSNSPGGLSARQAIQLGALVGVCAAALILVWLMVK